MKKLLVATGIATLFAFSAQADDDKPVKVEVGAGLTSYGDSQSIGLTGRANLTVPIVDRAFDIGIEVEGGTQIDGAEDGIIQLIEIDGNPEEVFTSIEGFGVQNHLAGYFMFRVPLDSGLGITVRAGYHSSNFGGDRIVEIPNLNQREVELIDLDFEGLTGGFAAEYFFDKKNGIRFDLTWFETSDLNFDNTSTWSTISYMRRF